MALTDDRDDPRLRMVGPDGQQEAYLVLSEDELAQGFVRPVRTAYVHLTCGHVTRMGLPLAQTYARDPHFYGATFCAHCASHFPVGPNGQFVWEGTEIKVGV